MTEINKPQPPTAAGTELNNLTSSVWLSTPRWTFTVAIDRSGIITFAAPVVASFLHQPLSALTSWLRKKHGSVKVKVLA